MANPSPVPPYLRLVLASACWKASKTIFCFSSGIPMPVSETSKAMTVVASFEDRVGGAPTRCGGRDVQCTPPCSVNLKAFDNKFFSTCCRRFESVKMLQPRCPNPQLLRTRAGFRPRDGTCAPPPPADWR